MDSRLCGNDKQQKSAFISVHLRFEFVGSLKKQTQLYKGQNDVKLVTIMSYEDFGGTERRKNKANSKPIHWRSALCVLRKESQGRRRVSRRGKMLITCAQNSKDLTYKVFGRRIRSKFCSVRILSMTAIKPNISVEYAGNTTIMRFTNEKILEEQDIKALQESIMSVIEQAERINLILDFANVRFLSSAVLGLLIRVSKRIYERDGQLGLCNINPKIYEIFKITRLTKTFDIYNSVESATEGLSEPN